MYLHLLCAPGDSGEIYGTLMYDLLLYPGCELEIIPALRRRKRRKELGASIVMTLCDKFKRQTDAMGDIKSGLSAAAGDFVLPFTMGHRVKGRPDI